MVNASFDHDDGNSSVRAWRRLNSDSVAPSRVDVLKRKNRSLVCRLAGVGPCGGDVIAKRRERDKATVERLVYEEILPAIGMQAIGFYGSIEEVEALPDGPHSWLFIEDIGDRRFSPASPRQRALLAEWLGTFHARAADLDLKDRLPDRGPRHHRHLMQVTLDQLPRILKDEQLGRGERTLLDSILTTTKRLEACWEEIVGFCEVVPETVVHGDCLQKNVHVRRSSDGLDDVPVPLDWSAAGLGPLGLDLGHTALPHRDTWPEAPDIAAYTSAVNQRWPWLEAVTLGHLERLGRLFWAIDVLSWSMPEFDYPWVDREKLFVNLDIYERVLVEASAIPEWGGEG